MTTVITPLGIGEDGVAEVGDASMSDITTAIDTHEATLGNHDDVDLTGAQDGDVITLVAGVWTAVTP